MVGVILGAGAWHWMGGDICAVEGLMENAKGGDRIGRKQREVI